MTAWRDSAACVGAPVDVFFPERGQTADAAREYCGRCPVTAECLAFAMMQDTQDDRGVYGGTTALDRRKLRSPQRSAGREPAVETTVRPPRGPRAASGTMVGATCAEDVCDRPAVARGLCEAHYNRLIRIEARERWASSTKDTAPELFCTLEGCDGQRAAKGLCSAHYGQHKRAKKREARD